MKDWALFFPYYSALRPKRARSFP